MKKNDNKVILFLVGIIIIILIGLGVLITNNIIVINNDNTKVVDDETSSDTSSNKDANNENFELKKFTFVTAYGKETIEAEEALVGQGSAGASNNIFYLKDNKLYLYGHGDEDELLANGVDKIYYKTKYADQFTVILNSSSTISKENGYIEYER
ncbi:MAG: hypothetical protein SPJ74_07770 [Bacilli bacterium]|nr:hypothetical protein [Bacilli bacterium]